MYEYLLIKSNKYNSNSFILFYLLKYLINNSHKWDQENRKELELVVNLQQKEDYKSTLIIIFRWNDKDYNKRLLGSRFKNPFMGSCMAKGLVV